MSKLDLAVVVIIAAGILSINLSLIMTAFSYGTINDLIDIFVVLWFWFLFMAGLIGIASYIDTQFERVLYPEKHRPDYTKCPKCGTVLEIDFDTEIEYCSYCDFTRGLSLYELED